MIKQKAITIKTAGATLTAAEMGDIIVNSATDVTITLPTPSGGLWYRISNVNTGIVTVYYGSALTTLKQTEQCLCLANGTSAWFFSKGGGAMTKPEIEAVLTGQISSHSHAPVYELPLGGNIGQVLKKNSANDRDVLWGDEAGGGTSFADVATGTGTITTTGWEANTGDYDLKLVLTVTGITADDKIFVTPDPDDMDIAIVAELCTSVDSGTDTLTFYCKTTPTATIGFSYIKFKGATNVLPGGGTAGQVLSKIDGVDYNVGWVDAPSGTSPLTTKGDVHVYGTTDDRLPVGANGQVLTADSTQTLGLKWATPNSGGASYVNPIDEPPASPHAKDDEFDDGSINTKWSWVHQDTATAEEGGQAGKISITPTGNSEWRGLVQACPSGNWTMTAKVHYGGDFINDSYIGLIVIPSTDGGIQAIAIGKDGNANPIRLRGESWNSWSSWGGEQVVLAYGPTFAYLKVKWDGTNLTYYASTDGVSFAQLKNGFAPGFTPGRIGIGARGKAAPNYFSWFRVTEP